MSITKDTWTPWKPWTPEISSHCESFTLFVQANNKKCLTSAREKTSIHW